MFAYRGSTTLFLSAVFFCFLTFLPMIRPYLADADSTTCSAAADEARFAAMREDILVKISSVLSLNVSSEWMSHESVQNTSRQVDPALLSAYRAASRALEGTDEADCERGRGTPFAKHIAVLFPINSSVAYMPPEMVSHEDNVEVGKDNQDNMITSPVQYTLLFNYTQSSQLGVLYSAELRLFKRIMSTCASGFFENVEVFYVLRKDGVEQERLLVSSKNIEPSEDEYDSFDVSEAVEKWIAKGLDEHLELEVVINCPFSTVTGLFSPPSIEFATNLTYDSEFDDTRPQLVIATVTEQVASELVGTNRKKRQIVDSQHCRDNPNVIHCCIRPLEVDFHVDLELQLILWPPTFTPNYCLGVCPVPFLEDSLIKIKIQEFYKRHELGGGPCCTIFTMAPLLLAILDPRNGEITMAAVPNMLITSCGCVD